jgi:hypothetical protein
MTELPGVNAGGALSLDRRDLLSNPMMIVTSLRTLDMLRLFSIIGTTSKRTR